MKHLAFLLLTLIACQSTSVEKRDQEIKFKETVEIHDVPRATLTFSEISDSRCPENANCFWAGYAQVGLTLTGVNAEGKQTKNIQLCLGDCRLLYGGVPFKLSDSLYEDFAGQKYLFILEKINPYPNTTNPRPASDYSISLRVEKK